MDRMVVLTYGAGMVILMAVCARRAVLFRWMRTNLCSRE